MTPLFAAVVLFSNWWGGSARLPVSFTEPTPPVLQRQIVAHMNEWSKHGNVRFYLAPHGVVRITRNPAQGYWSCVGREALDVTASEPTMALGGVTLANVASSGPGITHEAGHAIGLEHEHQRPEFVRLIVPVRAVRYYSYWYGWSANDVYWYVLSPLDMTRAWRTPPDANSIMMYEIPGAITYNGKSVGGTATGISFWDGRLIGALYPRR